MRMEIEGLDDLNTKFEALIQLADRIEDDVAPKVCALMRMYAVKKLSDQNAMDTGRLRASIISRASEFVNRRSGTVVEMGIATTVPYAQFIEYGTGAYGDPAVPHTPRLRWVYHDEEGFHTAKSQEARPFMRPCLTDLRQQYAELINRTITEVWES